MAVEPIETTKAGPQDDESSTVVATEIPTESETDELATQVPVDNSSDELTESEADESAPQVPVAISSLLP